MIWARLLLNCQNCCELDEAPPTLGVESWPNYLGVWRPLLQYSDSRHSPWRGCHSRLVVAARGKGKLRWWWAYALHWGDLKNFSHRSNSLLVWRPGVYRSSLAALSSPRTVYVFPVKDSSYWQDSAAGKSQGLPKSSSPTWRSENLNNSKVIVGFGVIASFVEAWRLDDGDLLVVIAPPHTVGIISDYALRWGLETLFGIFKTRGFCWQSTHFTDPDRLRPTFCSVDFSFGLVFQDWPMASSASSNSAQETWSSC